MSTKPILSWSFLGPLWPRVLAPDRGLSVGQIAQTNDIWLIELFEIKQFDIQIMLIKS